MMTAPSELEIWKLLEEGGRWQYGPGMWMSQGSGKGRPLNVLHYTGVNTVGESAYFCTGRKQINFD